jgi:hypothetical protein
MVTMIDEIFDRDYQAGRANLNAALAGGFTRLGRAVAEVFAVLIRIQYDAPWAARSRRLRSH